VRENNVIKEFKDLRMKRSLDWQALLPFELLITLSVKSHQAHCDL
jgi:hypothetical protein